VTDQEVIDLKNQISFLKEKVDSLEAELARNKEIEEILEHDSLLFSYRRTPCFGTCPIFEFKVYKDGWASYEGKQFVEMLGVYTAEITHRQMLEINRIFNEAHFYAFRDVYDDSRSDIPSRIIEYHGPMGVKKVIARSEIPHAFRTMAVELENLADQINWNVTD